MRRVKKDGRALAHSSSDGTRRTWCRVVLVVLIHVVTPHIGGSTGDSSGYVVGATDASEPGLAAATEAFTYRVLLLSESARQSCPFAREPDSPQSSAFWRNTYGDAMISLGSADETLSARDMYDVLDGIGSILTCCPGLLQNPTDSAAPPSSNSVPPLPSCGLLSVSTDDGPNAAGTDINRANVGYELTLAFSSTLRAARLPSVALEALYGAAGLVMTNKQVMTKRVLLLYCPVPTNYTAVCMWSSFKAQQALPCDAGGLG